MTISNQQKWKKVIQTENTVGKGEIGHYDQFLLFPQCFQKACFPGASNGIIVRKWVKSFPNKKIMDRTKSDAVIDGNLNEGEMMVSAACSQEYKHCGKRRKFWLKCVQMLSIELVLIFD